MGKGLLAKDEVESREDLTVLLAKDEVECEEDLTVVMADVYIDEVKRLSSIAGPMVAVNLSQYFLQVISVMMVGHLGELFLSSTAIAISFSAVTGFSLLVSVSIFKFLRVSQVVINLANMVWLILSFLLLFLR